MWKGGTDEPASLGGLKRASRSRATTSDQNTTLCLSCRSATIIDGPRQSDQIIACRLLGDDDRVNFVVTSCTSYSDKTLPSLYHMEDIAWILRSDPKRKQMGFVRSRDLKFEERHVLDE